MTDNWIIILGDDGFTKVIPERIFDIYLTKIDDCRVTLKKTFIKDGIDEENKQNDPHIFGDWSNLNAKITGYYKLIV